MEPRLTEADYIERARAGDTGAFRRLYDLHVDRVYGLAYRMVGDDEMARDITQEAFFRVYRRLEQFRGDAAFSTWLHAVTSLYSLEYRPSWPGEPFRAGARNNVLS